MGKVLQTNLTRRRLNGLAARGRKNAIRLTGGLIVIAHVWHLEQGMNRGAIEDQNSGSVGGVS